MPARAGRLDYEVDSGAQLEDVLTYIGDDGQPIDLATYTATLRVGTGDSTEPLLTKALTTGANGTVFVLVTDEETAAFPVGPLLYDIRLESAAGLAGYLTSGQLYVFRRL